VRLPEHLQLRKGLVSVELRQVGLVAYPVGKNIEKQSATKARFYHRSSLRLNTPKELNYVYQGGRPMVIRRPSTNEFPSLIGPHSLS